MKVSSLLCLVVCGLVAAVSAGNITALVQFANRNWNCADASCSRTVAIGQGQPDYQCAEFVSRSIAAGGFIPGLGPTAAQSAYLNFKYDGVAYDLLWVSSKQGGPKGLEDFIKVMGWRTTADNDVQAGHVLMLTGAEGKFSHTAIGVAKDLTDAHNVAHNQAPVSVYIGVDLIYAPPA
jgi:hypothetical protein